MTNKDFSLFPSPCYIMEEGLLRKNLALIKSVADRAGVEICLLYTSPSPRDGLLSRMPSSA